MNNFVPVVMLAMLSNMDFQATLTKDAVIEYMTKYMTKAGQGSLLKVMEHSFSQCIEKARDQQQGSGSAVLRWFNLQSITEVKSQLETMHILFGAPRYLCSRGFSDLWLHSEIRQAKTGDQIRSGGSSAQPLVCRSVAEVYVQRWTWELPSRKSLLENHALTREPWWRHILRVLCIPVADSDSIDARLGDVRNAWAEYLELLSRWQLKRFYKRSGNSLTCRPCPDVVVVHPTRRFTTARTEAEWHDACFGRCWRIAITVTLVLPRSQIFVSWRRCRRRRWRL